MATVYVDEQVIVKSMRTNTYAFDVPDELIKKLTAENVDPVEWLKNNYNDFDYDIVKSYNDDYIDDELVYLNVSIEEECEV